jgi:CDGSH-type Zn-finger protein
MKKEKPKIACLPNGPYYLLNDFIPKVIPNIRRPDGEPYATVLGVALCRCGGSKNKPFCDGTHGKNEFSDNNVTGRVSHRRIDYIGRKITVHDIRKICSHAGVCVRDLPGVFKSEGRRWVDPNGDAVEKIIETIRNCPSGALSYTVDGVEHRDQQRPPMVTVSKNGPYAVKGGIELLDQKLGEGASTEHYTLCRCGGSRNKPFCDGAHRRIGFQDDES